MLQRREPLADETINLIELTADIVSAYVSNNPVPVASLSDLIHSVNLSLSRPPWSLMVARSASAR